MTRPIRLLIMNHVAERGGAERVLEDILAHLDRSRYEPYVLFFEQGTMVGQMRQRGLVTEVIETGRLRDFAAYGKAISAIRRLIRSHGIDAAVSWMPKAHLYGGIAARLERKPAIWWQHGIPEKHWLDRLVSKLPADGILCPSNPSLRAQQRLTRRKRVLLNHLGVNLDEFQPSREQGNLFREAHGIPQDALVFTYMGRLQRWKRPDLVIRAFNRVSAGRNTRLLILGGALYGLEQDYELELRRLAEQCDDPSRIVFLGHQHQVAPILAATDVVVHASTMEPFGLVVVESMAFGLTVVAVNRGGPGDVITHGVDGFLYDGTERELVPLMRSLLDGEFKLARIGEAARETVAVRFTAQRMTEQFERNLQTLLPSATLPLTR